MSTDEPSRITVSRDALRADLTEMELRLRIYFDEQLKHKADAAPVLALQIQAAAMERGDFSPSHRRAILELINDTEADRQTTVWSKREQVIAIVAGLAMSSSVVLALATAIHTGMAG